MKLSDGKSIAFVLRFSDGMTVSEKLSAIELFEKMIAEKVKELATPQMPTRINGWKCEYQ